MIRSCSWKYYYVYCTTKNSKQNSLELLPCRRELFLVDNISLTTVYNFYVLVYVTLWKVYSLMCSVLISVIICVDQFVWVIIIFSHSSLEVWLTDHVHLSFLSLQFLGRRVAGLPPHELGGSQPPLLYLGHVPASVLACHSHQYDREHGCI